MPSAKFAKADAIKAPYSKFTPTTGQSNLCLSWSGVLITAPLLRSPGGKTGLEPVVGESPEVLNSRGSLQNYQLTSLFSKTNKNGQCHKRRDKTPDWTLAQDENYFMYVSYGLHEYTHRFFYIAAKIVGEIWMEFWGWMVDRHSILILRGCVEERAKGALPGSYSPRTQKNNNGNTRDNGQHIVC